MAVGFAVGLGEGGSVGLAVGFGVGFGVRVDAGVGVGVGVGARAIRVGLGLGLGMAPLVGEAVGSFAGIDDRGDDPAGTAAIDGAALTDESGADVSEPADKTGDSRTTAVGAAVPQAVTNNPTTISRQARAGRIAAL